MGISVAAHEAWENKARSKIAFIASMDRRGDFAARSPLPVFLVSALAIPQPWSSVQQSFVLRTFIVFISKDVGS
jgi:hypothetical protein